MIKITDSYRAISTLFLKHPVCPSQSPSRIESYFYRKDMNNADIQKKEITLTLQKYPRIEVSTPEQFYRISKICERYV